MSQCLSGIALAAANPACTAAAAALALAPHPCPEKNAGGHGSTDAHTLGSPGAEGSHLTPPMAAGRKGGTEVMSASGWVVWTRLGRRDPLAPSLLELPSRTAGQRLALLLSPRARGDRRACPPTACLHPSLPAARRTLAALGGLLAGVTRVDAGTAGGRAGRRGRGWRSWHPAQNSKAGAHTR